MTQASVILQMVNAIADQDMVASTVIHLVRKAHGAPIALTHVRAKLETVPQWMADVLAVLVS